MKAFAHSLPRQLERRRLVAMAWVLAACALPLNAATAGADVVIMIDMSMGETAQDPIVRTLSAGARVAATELKPGDRVSLVEFSGSVRTILPLTDNIRKFESALHNSGKWIVERDQRHLHDSLLTVLNAFPDGIQSERRRCIVVVTTAADAGSRHSANEAALAAKSKGTAIFVALISPSLSAPQQAPRGGAVYSHGRAANEDEEKKALEPLVRATGGEVRVYEPNQYVIAKAISEMVNK